MNVIIGMKIIQAINANAPIFILGATSVEKIPNIPASGRNFLDPLL